MGSHILLLLQIMAHLGLAHLLFYGSLFQWAVAFSIYFLTGCLGMSITFHRLLSHKSFKSPRWFKNLGIALGTIGLTGSAIAWVAVHREHHCHPDKTGDPHSPNISPWWQIQFFSMYHKPRLRIVKDLLKDPYIVFFHRHYLAIQALYVLPLFILSPYSVVYAYLAPAALLWHGGSFINTLGHIWGYRNYKTRDNSKNNPILGILMWGEGWHNNHHARPNYKSFRRKFWELDLSAAIIHFIETNPKKTINS